ncbi:hypothetical protein CJD36_014180 [Flavipsychrobacter stenotrophus]|uniref:DUF4249 domain-containing protein n=1 Tax=Flavipsychrobacter stenotrophus TaxID=2077091 RepID=A0A2S7SVZ1_9BACT|nr:hypothetical protein [Flavipsychrobacter stenotrophus]PQJ11112.1 hypothetical protein CJD36_014180 [Flavipsychrobacter stenotrophus]
MKKIILPLLVLMALSILPSCSEKFSVAAPYKSITIVYGLLDKGDTAHYIRIQKAFLDDSKSALAMAKESDSSFFNNINVKIKRISMSGNLLDTIHLNRVDLTTEGYPKEAGTFFNSPNYAYKFKGTLNPNYIYRIVVTNAATGEVDSAEAPIIDNTASMSSFYIYYLDDNSTTYTFDFAVNTIYQKIEIISKYSAPSNFNFNGYTTPASVAQAFIRFHWVDSNTVTGLIAQRSYDYNLGYKPLDPNTFFTYQIRNSDMYNAINTAMVRAPENTVRLMDRCELIMYLGTQDFYDYVKVEELQGTGLTGNEIQPTYTNVKGANVLGLYTSRCMRKGYVTIGGGTIEMLKTLDIVAAQRIVGTVYH